MRDESTELMSQFPGEPTNTATVEAKVSADYSDYADSVNSASSSF